MQQTRVRAVFMRGGTSKGVIFLREDLPAEMAAWTPIFLAVMGSPDPSGRQLDGMGGGISSLSKVCVVAPPSRDDADIDFTFAQVSIGESRVDFSGNCGNMSSAIGPFAVDEGLFKPERADGDTVVRIHNTNTGKIIHSRFRVEDGIACVEGDMALDGVAGTGAPIRLDFMRPGGAATGRLLPTGRAVDLLTLPDGRHIEATLVDAANPSIFLAAEALGCAGTESPAELDGDRQLMETIEHLRRAGAVAMGIAPDMGAAAIATAQPKIALVSRPRPFRTLAGIEVSAADQDIAVRMLSLGQVHRAVPLTGGLCLAAACHIRDSIPAAMIGAPRPEGRAADIRIAQPSGVTTVAAASENQEIVFAGVYRTARRLFEGKVLYKSYI